MVLAPNFKQIFVAIKAHGSLISFKELHDELVDFEQYIKREKSEGESTFVIANIAKRVSPGNTNQHPISNGGSNFFQSTQQSH